LFCAGIAAAAALQGGCAHNFVTQPSFDLPSFDAEDHRSFEGSGTATIKGQAFLRQKGGGVVTCAGSDVKLMPATNYFKAAVAQARMGAQANGQAMPMAISRSKDFLPEGTSRCPRCVG
jgi:hypothetical protein